jgi:sugar phosphate isomerase/epimerase
MIKFAYGTYATPTLSLEETIPLLDRLGYRGIEICVGNAPFDTLPDQIEPARRQRLRDLLAKHNLDVPALMMIRRSVLAKGDADHGDNLEEARKAAQLARDLGVSGTPVLSMGFGGKTDLWPGQRDQIAARLADYARVAREEDFVLAGEAHCGAAVDRSDRALWVVQTTNDARIRFHFDIVHLYLAGEAIEAAVEALLPITAHTHVTDAHKHAQGGGFDFRLLGQGDLDLVAYAAAMHKGGWDGFVTVEVSTRVWSQEGYEPRAAAATCYRELAVAFAKAGVPYS